jgi:hypothetical protein
MPMSGIYHTALPPPAIRMRDHTVSIARRFCGPPQSGNGGYVCGLLGRALGTTATVRLLAPPPLEVALQLVHGDDGVLRLLEGERGLAQAMPATLDLSAPAAPTLVQAEAASAHFVGRRSHPFPGCFVCGPERAEGDGLRLFPGRVEGIDMVAAPWTPARNLADAGGELNTEFVWSALDCTGFFAFAPLPDGAPALLGELTARIDAPVRAGEPHVVAGWQLGAEGRKRWAGSVIYDAAGTVLALARATWIVMPPGAAGARAS